MLFRALIDRLLGNNSSLESTNVGFKMTSRFSYDRYPNLIHIIVKLLNTKASVPAQSNNSEKYAIAPESVFPALHILQRAMPSQSARQIIQPLVFDFTRNPHWHIRDMAARAYASLIEPNEIVATFSTLLNGSFKGQNGLHGSLLTLKYMVPRLFVSGDCATDGRFIITSRSFLTDCARRNFIHTRDFE